MSNYLPSNIPQLLFLVIIKERVNNKRNKVHNSKIKNNRKRPI